MTRNHSDELSRLGTQLGVLAVTFAQTPDALRAVHIRRAERSLVALEEFARSAMPSEAQQWLQAIEVYNVLTQKIEHLDQLKSLAAVQKSEIDDLTKSLQLWNGLQDVERQKFLFNHQRAKQFVEQSLAHAESHILHKYSRYKTLNRLLPYADNAEHLCDAIFHYQNRERYEENLQRIEVRRENAAERLASVNRGFKLALLVCILIVTIPLCAPVAFSLWNRRREIENQLANMAESRRREERRLQIADEGVVASEEIKDILGDVPLEVVRRTLEELRELRSEFQRAEKNPSVTAGLVSFVDLYRPRIRELFGEIPEEMVSIFPWFKAEVDRLLNVEAERTRLVGKLDESQAQIRKILKGHNEEILRNSYDRVAKIVEENFSFPLEMIYKKELARQMAKLPEILREIRVLLSQLSYGRPVEGKSWQEAHRWTLLMEGHFQAMALEIQLAQPEKLSQNLEEVVNQ